MFPLSNEEATEESFNIFNYLPEAENRIGYDIETGNAAPYYSISGRSGSARDWGATTIEATGAWGQLRPNASCGVRPAFVMKLV